MGKFKVVDAHKSLTRVWNKGEGVGWGEGRQGGRELQSKSSLYFFNTFVPLCLVSSN